MQEGEIFGKVQWIKLGKLSDPLRDCPVCMVPWYGSIIYWVFYHGGLGNFVLTIIPAMGLNAVLVKLFPDKESPTLHKELKDIADAIKYEQTTTIGKPIIHKRVGK